MCWTLWNLLFFFYLCSIVTKIAVVMEVARHNSVLVNN